MPQTQLTLGDITFAGLEVPESISFGGDQALVVQKLVGGARVIDAMGRDDAPKEWSGYFMGESALDRALYLDGQRVLGQPLLLTWSQLRFLVVIRSFDANYQKVNHIPYRITCEVVEDQTSPVNTVVSAGIDDQMDSDMNSASGFGSLIGDSPLSGLLGTLGTAINAVSTFANATQTVINSVLQPIAAVQSRVQLLLASSVNTAQNIATVGGVLPNSPIAQSIGALGLQTASFQQQPLLLGLQSVMGRMTGNLGSVSGNTTTMVTAGGNLFNIAAQNYGDATSWTAIARANGLTDPALTGVQQLNVPKLPDSSGGLLGV